MATAILSPFTDSTAKKLCGFAYRNHVMVDYRHKRDSVYKIYKKV
jgi:hypothetical protein